jgi:cytoskeletal protein CcmA (bactofilin family)
MPKRILKIFLPLTLVVIILPVAAAKALNVKTDNSFYLAKEEITSGNLLATGKNITIDGTVSGDLIVAAQTLSVTGRVDGDIIAAAQTINVTGEVGGNVRVLGNHVSLDGPIIRNVNVVGNNFLLGRQGHVGWDVLALTAKTEIRGDIDGNLNGRTQDALIYGKIGKNINLNLSADNLNPSLVLSPESVVNGDVIYTSKTAAKVYDQATVSGNIKQNLPTDDEGGAFLPWLWSRIFSIFAAIVVGLVLVFLLKNIVLKISENIKSQPLKMIWPGLIVMLVLPPLALLLAFTLIGLPLALIILAKWLIAIYIAKIIAATIVGWLIIKKLTKRAEPSLLWSMVLGVAVCWLLFNIPFIGWLIGLAAAWLGLGGIWIYVYHQLRNL